nr:MGC173689 protein [Danio rerio]
MPKPISSGSHTEKQPYSKYETLKTTDEGSDRKPEMKEEELPQHSPYSGLPQQRPPQIREGTDNNLPWIGIFVVLVSVVCGYYLHFSGSTPNKIPKQLDMVEVFNQEMEKLQASFPSQRQELWKRSLIHIRRHLKTEHPTEPVSLILTSGHRAEKTLGCLAQCLAQAFSTTRNSTFLSIDGKAKTSLDSDQVKLDIDSELTKAFESEKFAAVIHRFEELPPGSTLIFYRYCDHENAAFKNVFLAFTVMLDAEAEVPSNINLGRIEEMVQDHVKQKFVSSDKSAVFNQMDVDKLSGLWSRISHLILPVVAEKRIEQQGCGACDKPF